MNVTFHNELFSNPILDSNTFKILHGIASIIVIAIAFISYFGFIHYEYYGEDPMRRSMKNQLVAQICKVIFTYNILATPVILWRVLFGPVYEQISLIALFMRHCSAIIIPLCFTEIILFQFLMLFAWKSFNYTNEDFMFTVISIFNIGCAIVTLVSRWMLRKFYVYTIYTIQAIIRELFDDHIPLGEK